MTEGVGTAGVGAAEGAALEAPGASGLAKTAAPTPVAAAAGTSGREVRPAWTGATEGDPTSTATTAAPGLVTNSILFC